MKQIKNIEELKQMAEDKYIDTFIQLNFGLRSSEDIRYNKETDTWDVFNYIDESTITGATTEELGELTNVMIALERGALYKY